MKEQDLVMDWADVKNRWLDIVADGKTWPAGGVNARNHHYRDRMLSCQRNPLARDSWSGGSGADTCGWLRDGYHAKEFEHSAEYVTTSTKVRAAWDDEEGEADPGRMIGGFDKFFLTREERPAKPGLRLQIEFAFAAGCPNQTIRDYGAWCAGLIGSLEAQGYDLTVDLWIYLDNLYEGERGTRTSILLRVKRENEVSDFTEWSALFAPTGYRHLGFLAKLMAGDKIGKVATRGLGTTIAGRGWGVEYDRETSTVKIRANQRAYTGEVLPVARLNEQATEAGLIPADSGADVTVLEDRMP